MANDAIPFLALVALILGAQPALAAPQCGDYAEIIKQLADKYHEQPIGHGLVGGKMVVILFVSKDGKTWTIVNAMPSAKVACLGGSGTDWQAVPVLPGDPS